MEILKEVKSMSGKKFVFFWSLSDNWHIVEHQHVETTNCFYGKNQFAE